MLVLWYLQSESTFKKSRKLEEIIELTLAHPAQHLLWGKYHILLDNGVLLHLAVDAGNQTGCSFILVEGLWAGEDWSYGSKFVKGFCVEKLAPRLLGELEETA